MEKEQQVMLERARLVAGQKKDDSEREHNSISVVEFLLVPEKYAVAGSFVSEVLPLTEITPIPGVPSFVMGVINLHGKIVSIVNLKVMFSLKKRGLTDFNKVIMLNNGYMEFGIVADAIVGTKSIALDKLSPPPLTLGEIDSRLIKGVDSDGLILLDVERILNSDQFIVNQISK